MPKSIRTLSLLALAAVALLVSSCGEGDQSGNGESAGTTALKISGPPLSKDEFLKRAERICSEADDQIYDEARSYRGTHEKELNKLSPVPAEEKLIRLIVFPSIRQQAKELEALGIPRGEEKKVKALFAAIAVGMKKAEKNPYAIEGEVPSEYPFDRYSELAREYGFGECANLA